MLPIIVVALTLGRPGARVSVRLRRAGQERMTKSHKIERQTHTYVAHSNFSALGYAKKTLNIIQT